MVDLNQIANEAFRITSHQGLQWLSFGIKATYIAIYFGITWKLLTIALKKNRGL